MRQRRGISMWTRWLLVAAVLVFAAPLVAQRGFLAGEGAGRGGPQNSSCENRLADYVADIAPQPIDTYEERDLVFSREEEKLARDVYLVLSAKWGIQAFVHIARAEQQHMDAIKILLDRYEIEDPVGEDELGVFVDVFLQNLYNELISRGRASEIDALRVGATIEDREIADLKTLLSGTDNSDVAMVYQNLLKGSRNHMRAFASQLDGRGESYSAQYLEQAEIDEILSSPHERGVVYDEDGEVLAECPGPCGSKGQGPGGGGLNGNECGRQTTDR